MVHKSVVAGSECGSDRDQGGASPPAARTGEVSFLIIYPSVDIPLILKGENLGRSINGVRGSENQQLHCALTG